jgi:peptide/nickel transport system substrate-binding protein
MKRMLLSNRFQVAAGTLAVGTAAAVAAFSSAPAVASTHPTAHAASGGVLSMESSPVGEASGFNPYLPNSAARVVGAVSMTYEPLFQANLAQPAKKNGTPNVYPFLATGYKWGKGGKSITFTIRKGVKWSDGQAFGPADVAFTYKLIQKNPSINNGGLPITGVSTSGDTVTVKFSSSEYANFQEVAGTVYIVPQHIWSTVGDPSKYLDANPVGTGPYTLQSVSASGVVMTANPNYWGGPFGGHGAPAVKTVQFPALSSNTSALSALLTDQVQWGGNFIPGFEKAVAGKPIVNNSPPGNTNSYEPNLSKWPTNQLAVRQAISDAIDRTVIGEQGEAGQELPVTNASGLPLPVFTPYLASSVKHMNFSPHANIAAANKVLKDAGYKKVGKYWALNGKVVKFAITDPSSYSDYKADDILAAKELQKAGIDATFEGLSVNQWNADMATGNFELTQHWSTTAANPVQQYNDWLNSSEATKTNRAGNFEGLKDSKVDGMLAKAAATPPGPALAKALGPIEKYVATNLPIIPTVYGSTWGQYNTGEFSGWPAKSGAGQYETAQPSAPTNEVVVLHLKPTS